MFRTRHFAVCAVFVAAAGFLMTVAQTCAAGADDKKPADDQEAKYLAVLQSDAPAAEKALACKKLAIYGGKDAVPSLAPLLEDEQLASWARIALQAIPDPAADDALRQAMGKLQGRLLIGVINSIAVRRDAKAADGLIERLKDADPEVASAAAVALGHVGGREVMKPLEASLADAPGPVRSAVAEGCIRCAEKLQADGNGEQAVRLFDAVCKAEVAKQRIVEATRGAILARGSAGAPLLVEQLRSPDKARFAIGLRVARELAGREATEALAAGLPRATPERQALLLLALADRGDTAALPAVLEAAKSGSEEVRTAAIRALGQLGNASSVPVLLEAGLGADAGLSQAALSVLAAVPGKDVDEDVIARLARAEGKARLVLIQLAGRRSIGAAVPLLLKAADDPDAQVRSAALISLGKTIAPDDLPVLMARVAGTQNPDEANAAVQAVAAACQRVPDREACAEQLAAALSSSPVAAKCRFLEVLAAVGGTKALQTVAAAAKDRQPEMQDTASRLLGEWMTMDAAPVLLDLAKNAPEEKYKVRALRGYIRLVRQFPLTEEQRAGMCRSAMETAERDDEKRLVLEVLERYPSVEMLRLAIEAAKVPSLKDEATAISLAIAQRIRVEPAEIRKLLAQLSYAPTKVEILRAEYGAGEKWKDVTEILRRHVGDFPVIALPSSSYNAGLGGDPLPGVPKELKIQYRINGKPGEVSLPENATIVLPVPK
ncbi:MAG: HEAT repeat domain-containing protein [Planctomycetota bacterium]|jgi:HEAT repeat protein